MPDETIVIDGNHCPNCGKPLAAGALAGLCPACLLGQGAATDQPKAQEDKQPQQQQAFVPPPLDEIQKLFPELQIQLLLGAGGMGAVYKARQPSLDRWVALKVLPARTGSAAGFAERFNREARALARLSHPSIVAVFEFGQRDTLHYFIMEFVDGTNLRQLERAGRISARDAMQIIPQICDALQYAHDEGVVHRDIKPENVLVDRKGRVKIADFGLAKIIGEAPTGQRLTVEGQVMGTPHYMAPEQVERPLAVDHRADIYALGVVFYEMLTGDLPLGKFSPPSRKVELDVRLDEVVLRALENDPERRYQRASEVKTRVETISSTPSSGSGSGAAPGADPKPSATRRVMWQGLPIIIEQDGRRTLNRKGVLAALALVFGVLTIAFAFVSAFTGRSAFGWIGVVGWPSVVMRLLITLGVVGIAVRRGLKEPWNDEVSATPGGTVIIQKPIWWRRRRLIVTVLVLLAATWAIGELKGTRLAPRQPELKVSQTATRDSKTGRLRAKLPGGGTVELIAIGEPGAAGNGWWAPDGASLGNPGYEVRSPVENSASHRNSKDLLFRFAGSSADLMLAGVRAGATGGGSTGGQVFQDGRPLPGVVQARLAWRSPIKEDDVLLGVAVQRWRTVATVSSSGGVSLLSHHHNDPRWKIQSHSHTDTSDGAQIILVFGPQTNIWTHRLVAVDTNGLEHTANGERGSPVESMSLSTYTFRGLRMAAVKEFLVQVRPIDWIRFPEVAVTPHHRMPRPAPPTFGPTREFTISDAIDFDSALLTNVPPDIATVAATGSLALSAWLKDHEFDAIVRDSDFRPFDMDFVALGTNDWDRLAPSELMKRVYSNYYRPSTITLKKDELPLTLGFRTREHSVGIIQFLDVADAGRGIALRFKLVQRGS